MRKVGLVRAHSLRRNPAPRSERHMFRMAVAVAIAAVAATAGVTAQAPRASASGYDVVEKSIAELQDAMASGKTTSRQLVEAYLARIRAYDKTGPSINAFITLNPNALETAAALDQERRTKGPRGPLHGIPIVVKDNYSTADMPTTGGSKALAGFETHRDAFMVKKLRDAGAVIVGKTNLHELAYGITTISSIGGQTKNPYDLTRNPGGSSGGTGAAIAANFAVAGMGTDTCGSIRIPSANNNLVGMRGTLGLSSRDGIIPLSLTQDIGGPLARSIPDLAVMLDATVGEDPADPLSKLSQGHVPRSYLTALANRDLRQTRIGVLTSYFGSTPDDAEVGGIVKDALDHLRELGAAVVDVNISNLDDLIQGSSVINAEFKFDLAKFLAPFPSAPVHSLGEILASGKYDPAVKGVFERAEAVEAQDTPAYRASLEKRETARRVILAIMNEQRLAALAYPTLRRKAAPIGQPQAGSNCQLSATTGLPALALPAGFSDDGVPVGFELLGSAFSEAELLRVGNAYEQGVHPRRRPASTP